MEWITVKEAAENWGVTVRQVQLLCEKGQVEGAIKFGFVWAIPAMALKPMDGRTKAAKAAKAAKATKTDTMMRHKGEKKNG
ncbi:MAG: DNA-binding protein [Coriobacteriaceae bacterium]|jgi:hypothetical protein|nr:DNA-binding protein [Coriobacteriaceae bacterium]